MSGDEFPSQDRTLHFKIHYVVGAASYFSIDTRKYDSFHWRVDPDLESLVLCYTKQHRVHVPLRNLRYWTLDIEVEGEP